jgi:hypothetical protein
MANDKDKAASRSCQFCQVQYAREVRVFDWGESLFAKLRRGFSCHVAFGSQSRSEAAGEEYCRQMIGA